MRILSDILAELMRPYDGRSVQKHMVDVRRTSIELSWPPTLTVLGTGATLAAPNNDRSRGITVAQFFPLSGPRRDSTWRTLSSRRDGAVLSSSEIRSMNLRAPESHEISSMTSPPVATPLTHDEPRHVPGPLAPAELVQMQRCFSPEHVRIVAVLEGRTRAELYLERDDAASVQWFMKVLRLWLAWRHKASKIRLLKHG